MQVQSWACCTESSDQVPATGPKPRSNSARDTDATGTVNILNSVTIESLWSIAGAIKTKLFILSSHLGFLLFFTSTTSSTSTLSLSPKPVIMGFKLQGKEVGNIGFGLMGMPPTPIQT